jgi:hypothetical protein
MKCQNIRNMTSRFFHIPVERDVFISSFINSKFFLIDSLIQSSDFTFGMPLRLVLEVLQDSILNVILSSKPYLT